MGGGLQNKVEGGMPERWRVKIGGGARGGGVVNHKNGRGTVENYVFFRGVRY